MQNYLYLPHQQGAARWAQLPLIRALWSRVGRTRQHMVRARARDCGHTVRADPPRLSDRLRWAGRSHALRRSCSGQYRRSIPQAAIPWDL